MNLNKLVSGCLDLIRDRRRRLHDLDAAFSFEPLLHDFHVQQAEEAAAEAKAKRLGMLRIECERCVVEPQFLNRFAERLEIALLSGFGGR